ncbi:MAG: FAD-dependent oxidoreductase [Eubacteriales bacterium]|nr:FAD-dependent oxidoreductase [Eubacteriales bacterium]
MQYHFVPNRTDHYDFLVCGGGPSGFAAAVSAARKNLKTAIIERNGCLGGVATSGCIPYMLAGRKLHPQTQKHVRVIGGLFDEVTDRLIADGKAIEPDTIDLDFNPFGWYPRMASGIVVDDLAYKILLENMCSELGIRIYYNTDLIYAHTEENRVSTVLVHNKDGIIEIQADLYADCTGDGDLLAMSGCSFLKGRACDGLTTPASLEMQLEHVDGDALVRWQNKHQSPKLVEIIEDLKKKGIWNFPYDIFVCMQMMEKDVFLINTIRQTRIDGTSEFSVSQALQQGRAENLALFQIIKTYFPGFENSRIRKISDWIGIRESRRLDGQYTITLHDALSGKKYPDCIGATTYNFDLPDPLRPSYDPMMGDAKTPDASRPHVVIQIPYRALLPKEICNLIAAGRLLSAEREVLGAMRLMANCFQTGQAAGTAAAMAHQDTRNSFPAVDTAVLRNTLFHDGIIDPETLPF